jgi:hypothetical protein
MSKVEEQVNRIPELMKQVYESHLKNYDVFNDLIPAAFHGDDDRIAKEIDTFIDSMAELSEKLLTLKQAIRDIYDYPNRKL